MSTVAAHPVHASVAFLRIPDFEALSVTDQAAHKEDLEARVRARLAALNPADRIVLDAEEGVAVVFFGEPGRAMDLTLALHSAPDGMPMQAGLSYGPLALSSNSPDARVFGDGLSGAASAARFATRGQVLVTETFTRALEASSPERAGDLVRAGEFTDTRVRVHAFYTPDREQRAMRQRKLAVFALGGAIMILLLGVLGRDIYQPLFRSRPAIVVLEVKPRGEVFVDGNSMGRIPPLTQFEIAPGKHRVVVRSPGAKPYEVDVDLQPGQRLTLTHTFPPPAPAKPDRLRDFKKRSGS